MLGNERTFFFVNYGLHVLFLTMNEMYFIFTEIIYIYTCRPLYAYHI